MGLERGSPMQDRREWKIGSNSLHFEPPDILWANFRGTTPLDEAIRLVDLYREVSRSGPFFLVADMKEADSPDAESRLYLSENARPEWVLGIVYIGAKLAVKAAAKGIVLATHMTGNAEASVLTKVHFVSTRDEACELVARLRATHGG
jgi:hypothetical protein